MPRTLTHTRITWAHQRHHKSRVSLHGPPCARDVSGTPRGEVRDIDDPELPDDNEEVSKSEQRG